MKIVQINAYYKNGSTGKICASISEKLNEKGVENYVLFTQKTHSNSSAINYNLGIIYTFIQSFKSKLFGNNGFNSTLITYRLIHMMKKIKPDIVHMHNLHAQNINLSIFLKYLKKEEIKTVFTFHDCWLLTGYCMHFDMIGCSKWKTGCVHCDYYNKYSWLLNKSHRNWKLKRKLISDLNPVITVPSNWMKRIVLSSELNYKSVNVIYNGINLDVFKPTYNHIFLDQYKNKHIVLGVAERWDEKKGLDVFMKLANELDDSFQIILVGTNEQIDKILPNNVISIHRTENQTDLVEIYTAAKVFVNTTREEVLGLVNIEALACGTPVITFNTGGSPECINEATGKVIEKNDFSTLKKEIIKCCKENKFKSKDCIDKALEFDEKKLYEEYIRVYENLINCRENSEGGNNK